MLENIKLEYEGAIAILTINRPEKRNAINNATVEEIDGALSELEKSDVDACVDTYRGRRQGICCRGRHQGTCPARHSAGQK